MDEPDAAERNWILRKDAAGTPPKEIAYELDRPDAMETVESVRESEWYDAYRLDDSSPIEQYEVLLRAVYGIESGYFTSITQQPFSRLTGFLAANAAVPALVTALVLAPFMSEITAGPFAAITEGKRPRPTAGLALVSFEGGASRSAVGVGGVGGVDNLNRR